MSSYSILYSAVVSGTASTGSAGDVLIPDATTGLYVKATTANRGTRRATGIALSSYVAGGVVDIQQTGCVPTTVTGFAAAAASWVRCSTTGTLEKVTPGSGDDLLGKVDTDGRFFLDPGKWDSNNYAGGGGGSFTAGGDLTGTSSSQTVAKINATTITTAGGALAVGAVLRTTAVGTADWGAVNLADTDAVTGVLPKANQGVQDMAGDVTGNTGAAVVAKVNGATVPAAGALTTGNAAYVSGVSALTYSALNLAGGAGFVTGTLPTSNGGWSAAASETLTNKTISVSANSLTATSGALGDTLKHDGTSYVRLALGAANQVLTVNAGGTDISWAAAAGGGTPGGASGDLQYNNAGAFGGYTPGAGVATWLQTPSSANLATAITDETGSGALVFGTAPLFKTTINLNNPGNTFKYVVTPAAIAADRILNLPLLLATDTVAVLDFAQTLTNKTIAGASNTLTVRIANDVSGLGANVATFLATPTTANLLAAVTGETGTGAVVFGTSPTVSDPVITSTSINNATSGTTINDCTLSGTSGTLRRLRFTDAIGPTVTGFDATGVADGTILRVTCAGGGVGVTHLGAGSAAANRVSLNAGITIAIGAGCYTDFSYDLTSALWRHINASAI